jgi:hypothetical protein
MLDRKLLHSKVNSAHTTPKSRKAFKWGGWQPTLFVTRTDYAVLAAAGLAPKVQPRLANLPRHGARP